MARDYPVYPDICPQLSLEDLTGQLGHSQRHNQGRLSRSQAAIP